MTWNKKMKNLHQIRITEETPCTVVQVRTYVPFDKNISYDYISDGDRIFNILGTYFSH